MVQQSNADFQASVGRIYGKNFIHMFFNFTNHVDYIWYVFNY